MKFGDISIIILLTKLSHGPWLKKFWVYVQTLNQHLSSFCRCVSLRVEQLAIESLKKCVVFCHRTFVCVAIYSHVLFAHRTTPTSIVEALSLTVVEEFLRQIGVVFRYVHD